MEGFNQLQSLFGDLKIPVVLYITTAFAYFWVNTRRNSNLRERPFAEGQRWRERTRVSHLVIQVFTNRYRWDLTCLAVALSVSLVMAYGGLVEYGLEPLQRARQAVDNNLPFCIKGGSVTDIGRLLPWFPVGSDTSQLCSTIAANILSDIKEASEGLSGAFEIVLTFFTAAVVLGLLLMPRFVWNLARTKLFSEEHEANERDVFTHRTHVCTLACLLVAPPALWWLLNPHSSIMEAGYAVAQLGSVVLSPLTLDGDQYLKLISDYLPANQTEGALSSVEHARGALHLFVALNAIVLLVLFEISKEKFIKPLLKDGPTHFSRPRATNREKHEALVKLGILPSRDRPDTANGPDTLEKTLPIVSQAGAPSAKSRQKRQERLVSKRMPTRRGRQSKSRFRKEQDDF